MSNGLKRQKMETSKAKKVVGGKRQTKENVKRRKTSNEGKRRSECAVYIHIYPFGRYLTKSRKTLQLKSNYYLIGTKMVVMRKLYVLWILLKSRYSGEMLEKMVSKI